MLKEVTITLDNANKELRSVIASTQELAEFNRAFFSVTQSSSVSVGAIVLTFDPELVTFLVLKNLLAVIFGTSFDNIPDNSMRNVENEELHSFVRAKADEAQRLLDNEHQKQQENITAENISEIKTKIKAHYLNELRDTEVDDLDTNDTIKIYFNYERHQQEFILPYLAAKKQELNKDNVIAARNLGTSELRKYIPYRPITSNT